MTAGASARPATRAPSKTLATWAAVLGGAFGLHRFYLHGLRDPIGWLYPWPTLLGLYGLRRADALGVDDRLAWLLLPLLGVTLSAAMLSAIVYGLTSDERWAQRHDPGHPAQATRWGPVLGAVVALAVGAVALTSTVAFGVQRFFEWQLAPPAASGRH
jgi:hypothetical protein